MKIMLVLLIFSISAGCSLEQHIHSFSARVQVPDRNGWLVSFPSEDGGIETVTVSGGAGSVILDLPRGRWIPVSAAPLGWGTAAGAVIWHDACGPVSASPFWRNPVTFAGRHHPPGLVLRAEAAPLAELLLSIWKHRGAYGDINLERIYSDMLEKSSGETRRIDPERLRSDILYHSLSSYSIRLLPLFDREFYLPAFSGGDETLILEPGDPASSVAALLRPDGRLSLEDLYDGVHRFRSGTFGLTVQCRGGECGWKIE